MSGWRDISTAPKDGRFVFLRCAASIEREFESGVAGGDASRCFVASWVEGQFGRRSGWRAADVAVSLIGGGHQELDRIELDCGPPVMWAPLDLAAQDEAA